MRYPNLRHLQIFRTLIQTLSVTETANLLHVSQPAVSKAMAQLQEEVGFQLFVRLNGRLKPSPDALRLLVEAERVLNQVTMFRDEVAALQEARHGRLSVAAIPALSIGLVADGIGRFMQARPKVHVELHIDMSYRIIEEVAQNRVELGYVHTEPQNSNVAFNFLGESTMVCQMHRDHRLAQKKVITPQDLRDEPLVFLDPASPPSYLIRESFAEAGIQPMVISEVNASHLAVDIVRHVGVAFVDVMSARDNETVCRPYRPRIPLRIYAIYSAHGPVSSISAACQEFVREGYEKKRPYLSEMATKQDS
nr:LysR family transcriptional regulator [Aureimonas fodinaquatilis]